MLIKNMDELNVNGSMGTVVEFVDPKDFVTNPDPYTVTSNPGSKPSSKVGGKETKSNAALAIKYPVVEFPNPKRRILIQPETWKVELPDGEVQVSRTQVCARYQRDVYGQRLKFISVTSYSRLGDVHPQVARTNSGSCQG